MSSKASKKKKRKNSETDPKKRNKPKKSSTGKKSVEAIKPVSPRVAKLMSRFKKARASDVSDKVFVAESPVHGKGLFAAKRIKANTVIGRLHGMPTFDDGIYVLWITDEIGLELTNDFKYINHNSNPNAAYSDLDVTVLKDVEPGEELLHDYGW
ncbi:MAG: SET domain-containing protein [Granulosicoccus sp.]